MTGEISASDNCVQSLPKQVFSQQVDVLADIYKPQINMAVWQRVIPESLHLALKQALSKGLTLNVTEEIAVSSAVETLQKHYALGQCPPELCMDIAAVVDMFGYLFDTELVGLRLRTLHSAMCPKFHFDRVPCRLVMTYSGSGTQWLANEHITIDNGRLLSAVEDRSNAINTLQEGEVALLKGSMWEGNEQTPLVHRSPESRDGEPRLLLTLDAM